MAFSAALEVAGGPPGDWDVAADALFTTLERHKLLAASEAFSDRMTAAQIERLRPSWRLMAARQLARASERERIFALFDAEAVPVVEIKGSAQHRALHGTATGRDSADLDLWVHPIDFRRSLRLLLAHGYQVHDQLDPDRIHGPLPNELPVVHRDLKLEVDVHRHLFASFYALDAVDALLRPQVEHGELLPEAASFYAIVSAGKDLWNTLRLVADLAAVPVEHDATIDRWARQTHTRGIVAISRAIVHDQLGPRPGRPRPDVDVTPFLAALHDPRRDPPAPDRARRYLMTRERLQDRLTALAALPTAVRYQDLLQGPVDQASFPLRRMRRLARTYLGTGVMRAHQKE